MYFVCILWLYLFSSFTLPLSPSLPLVRSTVAFLFYCSFIVHVILICVYTVQMNASLETIPIFILKQKIPFLKQQQKEWKKKRFLFENKIMILLVLPACSMIPKSNFNAQRTNWKGQREQEQMHWCLRFVFPSCELMKNEHSVPVQLSHKRRLLLCVRVCIAALKCVRIVQKHYVYFSD